jgi:hypothetical protein
MFPLASRLPYDRTMTRLSALAIGISLAACTSGDTMMANDMSCTAQLALTGTFTPDGSRPTAYEGCWGAGTWSFAATVSSNTCENAPALSPSYQFTAASEPDMNGDPIVDKFTLVMPDPSTAMNIEKISQLGNSQCEGEIDICPGDGTHVYILRPDLTESTGNTITGQGEFLSYNSPHCPTM